MAIIYSYPHATPTLSDTLVGSQFDYDGNPTKSFLISDIIALATTEQFVPYIGANQNVNLGSFNLTANSIIKAGGTNLQYLLADGSVTTGPVLTGFIPYVGATQAVDLGAYNLTVNGVSVGIGTGNIITNTVVGNLALNSNTTGTSNTVVGNGALKTNTIGSGNTAIGIDALSLNTTGTQNHAIGLNALLNNTTGTENCAFGRMALNFNTTGFSNVAIGNGALFTNSTGAQNIAVGLGAGGVTTGNFNILIGYTARPQLSTDSNSVVIGDAAIGVGSNTVVLGNTSITTTRLRGAVQGGSFVKDSGTASQYLMADGSVTTAIKTTYMMTGVFTNMFGGDPGGNNRDVLDWAGSSPASSHSSALPILQNCKITAAGFKWISSTPPSIGVGQSWTVNVYKLNNPLTDSTTADGNYTLVGALNITLTDADSGVTVGRFSSGLNLVLNAGDIIRIAGDETGAIGTTTEEAQLSVLFEVI
jgi:hypothetical protein